MKKQLLAMGMGLFATASVAQVTFPVKIGFENADKSENYHCKYANKVGLSEFGDWVNPHDGDSWVEQSPEASVNGDYGFMAANSAEKLNAWDRGFKLANLPIQEGKSYRMSFWLKGEQGKVLKAYISKGVEQLDKSFVNPSGSAVYGLNGENDYTIQDNEWHHVSFVAYNHGAAPYNTVLANTSWMGTATLGANIPESLWAGIGLTDANKDQSYRAFFNEQIPEIYFAIINMYDEGTFMIDDIMIEEDKTFSQATYNGSAIKLDFGYNTNANSLVSANKRGYVKLDPTQFSVKKDGKEIEIASAEIQGDGVYVFLKDADAEGATISFTPNAECPLQYAEDKRPSNETGEMQILGFADETLYEDANITAEANLTELPELLTATPENGSFDLPLTTNTFTFDFDIAVDPNSSYATIVVNGKEVELTCETGENDKQIIVKYDGQLAKGTYTINLSVSSDGYNSKEVAYKFSVGYIPMGDSTPYTAFQDAFNEEADQSCPHHWVHYEDGAVKQAGRDYNYTGGRLFKYADGGDFVTGMYLRYKNGTFTFGDLCNYAGQNDRENQEIPEADEEADYLKLEAGNYRLSYNFIGWKEDGNTHTVSCSLYPIDNADATLFDVTTTTAANSGGNRGNKVTGSVEEIVEFTVTEPGNYVLKFYDYFNEIIIGNIKIDFVPGDVPGVAEKSALQAAYDAAMAQLDVMENLEEYERYTGAETELLNAIYEKYTNEFEGNTDVFAYDGKVLTAPSEFKDYENMFKQAVQDAKEHVVKIDNYYKLVEEIQNTINVEEGEKITKTTQFANAKEIAAKYMVEDEPKIIKETEELATAVSELQNAIDEVKYMKGVTGTYVGNTGIPALTARIDMGLATISAMGDIAKTEEEEKVIELGENAITDDDNIANALKKIATLKYYTAMQNAETAENFFKEKYSEYDEETETGGDMVFDGSYNFSFFLKNPNIYIKTDNAAGNIAGTLTATNIGTEDEPVNIYTGDACPGWTISEYGSGTWSTGWNTLFRADIPIEAMASNWGGDYTISQTIEDLPAGLYVLKAGVNERDNYQEDSYFFWQTSGDEDRITMNVPKTGQNWFNDNISSARRDAVLDSNGAEATTDEDGNEIEAAPDAEPIEILDGKLTIGAHAGASSHIFINKFGIYLVGGSKTYNYKENDFITGIDTKSAQLQSVAVYDVNGRQVVRAGKGVNIVKRTYSDGSVKVAKYIVK